jgi:hypothetical protein
MAGLVPAIHVFSFTRKKDVDARDEPGHDEHWGPIGCRNSSLPLYGVKR